MTKHIAILGSTGSIGTQALDVIARHADMFEATVLTAGRNDALLARQARQFRPDAVVIADESRYAPLKAALADTDVKVFAGQEAIEQVAAFNTVDTVLTAVVGFAGLRPTVSAIKAGKTIALANKETLVVAGSLINSLLSQFHAPLLPVDSEHSAIFQSLVGEAEPPVRLLLTSSGGPFRDMSLGDMASVTPEQALRHPRWHMGDKITIDSATMMNKGFEMIEACHLFGVKPEQVEIVVHPESILHSAVQFADGSVKGQMALPDMRVPIQYALSFPRRLPSGVGRLSLAEIGKLSFFSPDYERFPMLRLAFSAMREGGDRPLVLNAANEVANLAFRQRRIGFLDIASAVEQALSATAASPLGCVDDYIEADRRARQAAQAIVAKMAR